MPQYESTYHHQKLHKPLIRKDQRLFVGRSIREVLHKGVAHGKHIFNEISTRDGILFPPADTRGGKKWAGSVYVRPVVSYQRPPSRDCSSTDSCRPHRPTL